MPRYETPPQTLSVAAWYRPELAQKAILAQLATSLGAATASAAALARQIVLLGHRPRPHVCGHSRERPECFAELTGERRERVLTTVLVIPREDVVARAHIAGKYPNVTTRDIQGKCDVSRDQAGAVDQIVQYLGPVFAGVVRPAPGNSNGALDGNDFFQRDSKVRLLRTVLFIS